jgi:exodeoxyribonuclease V alpha subunit
MDNLEQLSGVVADVRFVGEEGFQILTVRDEAEREVTLVAVCQPLNEGESVEAHGAWTTHPRFGQQFKAERLVTQVPRGSKALGAYLASGKVAGVGPTFAKRLVAHFGDGLRDVLGDEKALRAVPGIGKKKAARIAGSWNEYEEAREALIFLQGHGLGASRAMSVFRQLGQDTIAEVSANPYRTLLKTRGIGFRIADTMARSMGFELTHRDRIIAGLRHVVDARSASGHTLATSGELASEGAKLLEVDVARTTSVVELLLAHEKLEQVDGGLVGLPALINAERTVAAALLARSVPWEDSGLASVDGELSDGRVLSDEQREALVTCLAYGVAVLTGGPGVGKTTVTEVLAQTLDDSRYELALCAPTGRAARRMSEATGRPATTIHRLLGAGANGFEFNADNPIEADVVIIDEASMVDVQLFRALVVALPDHCRLYIIGDQDQLASVGPGNVLRDVIASGRVPVARLQQIRRQGEGSQIIVQAHAVNQGHPPQSVPGSDFEIVAVPEGSDPELVLQEAFRVATTEMLAHGFDTLHEVQVLTPMHGGPVGTRSLNDALRAYHIPGDRGSVTINGRRWAAGDKIVQTENDYNREVFNGDLGFVVAADPEEKTVLARFEDREVLFTSDALGKLQLAYAMTGHKAQGSEFPAVVIPLARSHWHMLERQWLYTSITRGKRRVVLVGHPSAIERAARHVTGRRRLTSLPLWLRQPTPAIDEGEPHGQPSA